MLANLPAASVSTGRHRERTDADVAWWLDVASTHANIIISDQYDTCTYRENISESRYLPVRSLVPVRVRAHLLLGCLTPGEQADNGTRKHASRGIDNAPCVYGIPGPAGAIRYTPGSLYHTFWGYAEK